MEFIYRGDIPFLSRPIFTFSDHFFLYSSARENKPYSDSDSLFFSYLLYEKPSKIILFCSYGEYAIKMPRLQKYGRIAPH